MSDACDLLVTGAKGQLGRAVLELAAARGLQAVGVDVQEMPLDDRASVQRGVAAARPRFVLHCGAITNVDGCEAEPLLAYRINGLATAWVAEAAAAAGAGLAYVSTDFVFDGQLGPTPYPTDADVRPLSVYGASKRLGEEVEDALDALGLRVLELVRAQLQGLRVDLPRLLDRERHLRHGPEPEAVDHDRVCGS